MYLFWNFKIALKSSGFSSALIVVAVLVNFALSRLSEELACMSWLEIGIPAILYISVDLQG